MKCTILHECPGRLRIHAAAPAMSLRQADILEAYLKKTSGVEGVKVYDRTGDAVIRYTGSREAVLRALSVFSYDKAEALAPEHSSRELNREFEDKLVFTVLRRAGSKLFLPMSIRTFIAVFRSIKYIKAGLSALLHGHLAVSVLDATAVTVSMLRSDFETASSVMFMLNLGEILEDWTHKKSVADLAGAMSLNVDKVWLKTADSEVLVPIGDVKAGDCIVVRTGGMIPLDGKVDSGEATVNQASITGESLPVPKSAGSYVYAGTVVEEGEFVVRVEKAVGGGRYDRIVKMIEESEKLKSTAEDKASRLADRLVPYTLGGTALTYLLTRNTIKALAVLMVDFSCALKLSMPIAVLSAMRESSGYHISVKGGRFMEAVANADTVVFDKTGTLTRGTFEVTAVHPEGSFTPEQVLEYAALAEQYSTHPIAVSLRNACKSEMDSGRVSDVEEIAGHGILAKVDGRTVGVGNSRLMERQNVNWLPCELPGTIVHVTADGFYAGHIVISDLPKPDSKAAIAALKRLGVKKTVMLTGDSAPVAEAVAAELGLDEFHAELLPADKVSRVEELLKKETGKLAFVGDGINDAPVLTRADIGIAMGGLGSDAAIEAADVVLMDDQPSKIAVAIGIARKTVGIVHQNIVFALAVKAVVLVMGALGKAPMWLAVFADVGVAFIAILNAMRCLNVKEAEKK